MNDKIKDVSFSAIAGELRKSAKLYDVFKNASEAADILAGYESEAKKLVQKKQSLMVELDELDRACDESYKNKEAAELAISSANSEATAIIKGAKKEASDIKTKASDKAEKIVEEANSKLEFINTQISKAKEAESEAKRSEEEAIKALVKLQEQINVARNKFLDTLG